MDVMFEVQLCFGQCLLTAKGSVETVQERKKRGRGMFLVWSPIGILMSILKKLT